MSRQDMSLPPEEFLLNVLNYRYGKNFTFNDFYFGDRKDVDKYGCESMIYLHAKSKGPYTGSLRAFYNRIRLDDFLEGQFVTVGWREFFDTDDLLGEVLEQLGINLERKDIVSDIIDRDVQVTKIRISNRSLVYKGYIPVLFMNHPDSLSNRVPSTLLNGFFNTK